MADTLYFTIYEKPIGSPVEVLHIQKSLVNDAIELTGEPIDSDTKGSIATDDYRKDGMEIFLSVEEAIKFYEKKYGLPLRILYFS